MTISSNIQIYEKFIDTLQSGALDADRLNRAAVIYIMIQNCFESKCDEIAKRMFFVSVDLHVWDTKI